jgi:hypothetical protein
MDVYFQRMYLKGTRQSLPSNGFETLPSNGFENNHVCTAAVGNSDSRTVFSARHVPGCYKQDSLVRGVGW